MKKVLYKFLKKQSEAFNIYDFGNHVLKDKYMMDGLKSTEFEKQKGTTRTEIINKLIEYLNRPITYLEIGVRNPNSNFNFIQAEKKYGVDPGLEYEQNPVDFKMTSDDFFKRFKKGEIKESINEFDIIFIDGLHFAEQVDRDISNALSVTKDDGFIVLHDCNPPTQWHAREEFDFQYSPARKYWNGTTWKAFVKCRSNTSLNSCCIDSDYGVGILSKNQLIGEAIPNQNEFFEYAVLEKNRKSHLNLISYEEFLNILKKLKKKT